MQGQRKQRIPRIRKRVPARFGTTVAGARSVGFTVNISARGLCLSAPSVHPAGTRLQIDLTLPQNESCMLVGTVAWSMRGLAQLTLPGTMGIRIESSDEKFFAFLAQVTPPAADSGSDSRGSAPRTPAKSGGPSSSSTARTEPPSVRAPSVAPTIISPPSLRTAPSAPPARVTMTPAPPAPPREEAGGAVQETTPMFLARGSTPPPDGSPPMADWWQAPAGEQVSIPPQARHRAPRILTRITVQFGASQPLNRIGATENLSRTGIAVACAMPLTPGESVLFALLPTGREPCHGTGVVAWTRLGSADGRLPAVMGIRLQRMEESYRALLDALSRP